MWDEEVSVGGEGSKLDRPTYISPQCDTISNSSNLIYIFFFFWKRLSKANFGIPKIDHGKEADLCLNVNEINSLEHATYNNIKFENVVFLIKLVLNFFFILFICIAFHFLYELTQQASLSLSVSPENLIWVHANKRTYSKYV